MWTEKYVWGMRHQYFCPNFSVPCFFGHLTKVARSWFVFDSNELKVFARREESGGS